MEKKKVLFVCIHNSARSQMAEAWLKHLCGEFFEVHSAGLEPGTLNPIVVEVMQEEGIDISFKKTQSVFDLMIELPSSKQKEKLNQEGKFFNYVITVCDEASAERCPIFPGAKERLHWSFPDPAKVIGTKEEKLKQVREIRDFIKIKIENWCEQMCFQYK